MKISKRRLIEIITQEAHRELTDTPVTNEGLLDKLKSLTGAPQPVDMSAAWDIVIKAAQDLEQRYAFVVKQNREFAKKLEDQSAYIKTLQAKIAQQGDATVPNFRAPTEDTEEIPLSQEAEKLLQRKLGI